MSEARVRTYMPGDEDRIAELLRTCFGTFSDYGINGKLWLELEELNEGFKKEGAYVLEVDGKVVSHVQVVEKKLRTALGFVDTAGIANVSTHPDYRGRGYASTLLRKAMTDYKKRGFPLTGLFTGFASGPQRIYRRLGYVDVCLERGWVAPIADAREEARRVPWIEVREAEDRDLKAMMAVYEELGEAHTGWPARSEREWREKLFKRSAYHSFFYAPREPGNLVVAEEGGEVLGYLVSLKIPGKGEEYTILELVARPGRVDALQALYTYAVERAAEKDARIVSTPVVPGRPYRRLFRRFGLRGGGVFMCEILDFKALVSKAFERRLHLPAEHVRLELKYRESTAKIAVDGEISPWDGEVDALVDLDPEAFVRALFGLCSPRDLLIASKVKSEVPLRVVAEALAALLPAKPLHVWPIDSW